ncbi:uncharacterized protein LOC117630371 [Prunus dulcis]|uniref:uncharacterized protein LOC117630371 n=1 Tax=Prunus dulcis TaxID=3755 RepID=UPI00148212EC|nr:uncharacterized protein LOC117630371 [Prunus dulcis]
MSTKSQRSVNWRLKEDEALCKGWVFVNEDGAIGTNQTSDTFWKLVYQKFLENDPGINGPKRRTYQAITSRFKTINHQCSLWKACLTKANTNTQSGSNLYDVNVYAKTIFLNDNKPPNRPFKLYHAWEILKDCPKWNDINEPPTQRSSGGSARKMAEPSQQTRDKYLETLVEQGIAFEEDRRRKHNILDKFVQDQADAYVYQKQQDKEVQEQKIMSMDVSKFTQEKEEVLGG